MRPTNISCGRNGDYPYLSFQFMGKKAIIPTGTKTRLGLYLGPEFENIIPPITATKEEVGGSEPMVLKGTTRDPFIIALYNRFEEADSLEEFMAEVKKHLGEQEER
jgi:hypothetical protein